MLTCPKCVVPLGEVSPDGYSTAVCTRCRYKFGIMMGRLSKRSSRQRTVRRQRGHHPGVYERSYELRVEMPGGSLEVITFKVKGKDDWVNVHRGDDVAVIYSMQGERVVEYLVVHNLTTSTPYRLANPGDSARRVALPVSFLVAAGFVLLLWTKGKVPLSTTMLVGVASWIVSYFGLVRLLAPRVKLDEAQQQKLDEARELLRKKQELVDAVARHQQERKAKDMLKQQLAALRDKMTSVGVDLYGSKIENVETAIRIIEQQQALEQQLIDEYGRAITIIEIEYETGQATEAMPGGVLEATLAKLTELEVIEEQNRALNFELEANEEIAQLLR